MAGYIVLYFYITISSLYGHIILGIYSADYRHSTFTRVQGRSPACLQQTAVSNVSIYCRQRNILACFCYLHTDSTSSRSYAYIAGSSRYFAARRHITIRAGKAYIRSSI